MKLLKLLIRIKKLGKNNNLKIKFKIKNKCIEIYVKSKGKLNYIHSFTIKDTYVLENNYIFYLQEKMKRY